MPRLPDFILIGAMKAGTTTLFRRLGAVDGIATPDVKEPHFFSNHERWELGTAWYASLFDRCSGITGEASTSYSTAVTARLTAERMASVVPNVRILYALRDPVERMRSHYRHQVLRAREVRPFHDALADPDNEYLAHSLYGEVIRSYQEWFSPDRLLIFHVEDLDAEEHSTWDRILAHIGASPAPMPSDRLNVSTEKRQFTKPLLWLWERGIDLPRGVPKPIRRIGKSLLTRQPSFDSGLLASVDAQIPPAVLTALAHDRHQMSELDIDIEIS